MAINAIYSHNIASQGSKELAEALDVPRIRHQDSKFRGGHTKTVLNWGAAEIPAVVYQRNTRVINRPEAVTNAIDKLATFRLLRDAGVTVPDFGTDRGFALVQLAQGRKVFARTLLRASSGRGIEVMYPDQPETHDVVAPLYVRYMPKEHEYRVHVVNGVVIDMQRKGLREEYRGQDDVNWMVRNLANGFVFVRNDGHEFPEGINVLAIRAVAALGLDFGAVDIITTRRGNAYVLEVNSAPGLQGETVQSYANALRDM